MRNLDRTTMQWELSDLRRVVANSRGDSDAFRFTGHCPVVHKLAGVTVRITDAGGTNLVEIDMLVTADSITEAPAT
ncbi:hypothetical protein ACFVX3_31230 [Rhodococcus erythropolis]